MCNYLYAPLQPEGWRRRMAVARGPTPGKKSTGAPQRVDQSGGRGDGDISPLSGISRPRWEGAPRFRYARNFPLESTGCTGPASCENWRLSTFRDPTEPSCFSSGRPVPRSGMVKGSAYAHVRTIRGSDTRRLTSIGVELRHVGISTSALSKGLGRGPEIVSQFGRGMLRSTGIPRYRCPRMR